MSKFGLTIQTILFCLFFALGIAAIGLSALSNEISDYYYNNSYLAETEGEVEEIKELLNEFDQQISIMHQQPEILDRLKPIQLGQKIESSEEVLYPIEDERLLEAAEYAVADKVSKEKAVTICPEWLIRLNDPTNKRIIFAAGSLLILIAFGILGGIWGVGENTEQQED